VPLVALLVLLVTAVVGLAGCSRSTAPPATSSTSSSSGAHAADPALKPAGMNTIAQAALPTEARDVIRRVDDHDVFQYRQDGVTFQNRERRLPARQSGYYHEYTVDTPGASDRGARRLVVGSAGELYYTPDHYRSFLWVVRGGAT